MITHKSDAELQHEVLLELARGSWTRSVELRAVVERSVVVLDGTVELHSEREEAERVVRTLAGVRSVENRLRVEPAELSHQVQRAIEEALARHAQREARNIQLSVSGDRVHLSGHVQSREERELVIGAVRGTHGVGEIEDHLRVDRR